MIKSSNISPILLSLLHKRGLESEAEIEHFLNPTESDFSDPYLLHDMDRLVDRIRRAVRDNEKVLIFGDYDVDGISATAILIKYFEQNNFYVDYFLPNRYVDGYGLTCEAILKIKEKYNPSLIITVDCGISCYKEVEFARTLGIEIAVTDHHDIPDIIPSGIVVDPKLEGQDYPCSYLCGTGVAFKVVQALSGLEEARKYLGICAIATIADIVPLLGENRAIVKLGMQDFESNLPLGIKMLFEENDLPLTASSSEIAFRLAPKINASGRMGDASVALRLYIKKDKILLKNSIEELNRMNNERQALCNKVYADASEKLSRINVANYNSIVLYSKDWDSGILGIVASRIAGEYNRPTILLSDLGEELKGSARSINDIDILKAISSQKEVLVTFGGHKMAAGLTIEKKNFTSFLYHLNEYIASHYTPQDFLPRDNYDYELSSDEVTLSLVEELKLLEPTGCDNPKAVFKVAIDDHATITTMKNHPRHINIISGNMSIVAFNSYKSLSVLKLAKDRSAFVELQDNAFRSKKHVKAIARSFLTGPISRPRLDVLHGEYLKQLFYDNRAPRQVDICYNIDNLINKAEQELFGTLIVCNEYSSYQDICKKTEGKNFKHFIYSVLSSHGQNGILLCPAGFDNLGSYKRIIFVDSPLSSEYLGQVCEHTSSQIMIVKNKKWSKSIFSGLATDRATFATFFKLISTLASSRFNFADDIGLFREACNISKTISFKQFIFCLYTFIELELFRMEEEMGLYTLVENKGKTLSLTDSAFYNKVNLIINAADNK